MIEKGWTEPSRFSRAAWMPDTFGHERRRAEKNAAKARSRKAGT